MRVLFWHVHGGYADAFVRGAHEYLVPVDDARDAWGLGLAGRDWPSAREVPVASLREEEIDVVVLQRPEEWDALVTLTGRVPGRDVPAVYLEHNTPKPDATGTRHPMADAGIPIVHVTHFNRVFWDNGDARTIVVEHGVPDPGPLYTGELPRAGAVINEPVRRWRVTGTDLLPRLGAPVDVFGMGGGQLRQALGADGGDIAAAGDLPTARLHAELARRRVYVHPFRWTSLGLALLEAMHLGMPVVALAATEAPAAVPPDAGVVSNDLDRLRRAVAAYLADPALAAAHGRAARRHALEHYGLAAFLRRWDAVLADAALTGSRRSGAALPSHAERSMR
ncbi:glycosyltransferase [Microbacterium album]|uniref:D-inositol 3-phosphate glycosyltransferase n=1 Tax=Microbacterium album TaxID=2053191 RepID=A0A917IH72_9MICO|nr:glycosyltransferase [Microbacterium album]GGH45552.1 glycosyl transferase [Microbacterium album]